MKEKDPMDSPAVQLLSCLQDISKGLRYSINIMEELQYEQEDIEDLKKAFELVKRQEKAV